MKGGNYRLFVLHNFDADEGKTEFQSEMRKMFSKHVQTKTEKVRHNRM